MNKVEVFALLKEMMVKRYLYQEFVLLRRESERDTFDAYIKVDEFYAKEIVQGEETLVMNYAVYNTRGMRYRRRNAGSARRPTRRQRNDRSQGSRGNNQNRNDSNNGGNNNSTSR